MATNAAGAAASVEHFVPLLSKAENPRVVFMSSGAGSLKLAHDFGFVKDYPAYSVSKAAENMVMLYYHHRFPEWKVNASNPGFRVSTLHCPLMASVRMGHPMLTIYSSLWVGYEDQQLRRGCQ